MPIPTPIRLSSELCRGSLAPNRGEGKLLRVPLENLGLVLDPFERTLSPMRMMLASLSALRRRLPVGPKSQHLPPRSSQPSSP
jgi:hypothetical protein